MHQPDDGHGHAAREGHSDDRKDPARSTTALTEDERRQVTELQARDRQVRAHEMAHKAAAGQYSGAVAYDYQAGPDGKRYAVGGEVSIDASPIPGNHEATIRKMQVIARAALAPAEPSAQDRAVAHRARQVAAHAQHELAMERLASDSPVSGAASATESSNLGQAIDTIV